MSDDEDVRGGITRVNTGSDLYEGALETIERCKENGQGFVLLAPGYMIDDPTNLVITTPCDPQDALILLDAGTSIMRRFASS